MFSLLNILAKLIIQVLLPSPMAIVPYPYISWPTKRIREV
jgi:hypothetical protein